LASPAITPCLPNKEPQYQHKTEKEMNGDVSSTEVRGQEWGSQTRDAGWNPVVSELQSQLEDLRIHVWECEADWRLDDRIDRAVRASTDQ
jgi:hypothetical protein